MHSLLEYVRQHTDLLLRGDMPLSSPTYQNHLASVGRCRKMLESALGRNAEWKTLIGLWMSMALERACAMRLEEDERMRLLPRTIAALRGSIFIHIRPIHRRLRDLLCANFQATCAEAPSPLSSPFELVYDHIAHDQPGLAPDFARSRLLAARAIALTATVPEEPGAIPSGQLPAYLARYDAALARVNAAITEPAVREIYESARPAQAGSVIR